jgi:hypothetical protein
MATYEELIAAAQGSLQNEGTRRRSRVYWLNVLVPTCSTLGLQTKSQSKRSSARSLAARARASSAFLKASPSWVQQVSILQPTRNLAATPPSSSRI